MNQDNDLFFPEAKTVDKLLSVFNIQSEQKLHPEKVINILSLLNLLNITSTTSQSQSLNPSTDQTINNLVSNLKNQSNNNNLENLMNTLQNNSSDNSSSPLSNLLSMTNNNNQSTNLDPTLVLKLMNLINQFKSSSSNKKDNEKQTKSSNEPVKSEPNSAQEKKE